MDQSQLLSFNLPSSFYITAAPILILCVGGLFTLMQSVIKSASSTKLVFASVISWIVLALITLLATCDVSAYFQSYLAGSLVSGQASWLGSALILSIGIVVCILMRESFLREKFFRAEVASLFLMMLAGMLMMVSTQDLISLFVGLELASIGLYPLVGYIKADRFSIEGAVKYFVLGSVAAAVLLFGFAFLYAATGSLEIPIILKGIAAHSSHPLVKLGAILTGVGFAFKMALVPFHLWSPDAYEAAPTGITAFMATAIKIMVIVTSLRFFTVGMQALHTSWLPVFMIVAAMSMLFGNILALVQTSLKRMLAYSSIAHSGYIAVALCALSGQLNELATSAVFFYLISYTVVSLGSFSILMWFESETIHNLTLDDLSGLAKKYPRACLCLAIFMFSLGGMPPTVGFFGKFFVFNAALGREFYGLIVIGAVGSTISLFYYLRVIVKMYMTEPAKIQSINPKHRSVVTIVVATVCVIFTILFGTILPSSLLKISAKPHADLVGQVK